MMGDKEETSFKCTEVSGGIEAGAIVFLDLDDDRKGYYEVVESDSGSGRLVRKVSDEYAKERMS